MTMHRVAFFLLVAAWTVACSGGGGSPGDTGSGADIQSFDDGAVDVLSAGTDVETPRDVSADAQDGTSDDGWDASESPLDNGDAGALDLDEGVTGSGPDQGVDTSSDDAGAAKDTGTQQDAGPPMSEVAASCVYVMEHLCDKVLIACDLLGLIPQNWVDACTAFLTGNDALITTACLKLDDTTFSDPNAEMIKNLGAPALRQCVDNFECTMENLGKIVDNVIPIIQGQSPDVADILALVADLCF